MTVANVLPSSRTDVVVTHTADGQLVLDDHNGVRIARLDSDAAAVWLTADGARDARAIARLTQLSALQVALIGERLIELNLTVIPVRPLAEVIVLADRRAARDRPLVAAPLSSRSPR